jgi:undecaprenyl-diphosphatase
MGLWLIVLLAFVQGVAEFLPISSSGHLRIFQEVLGLEDPQTLFDVMLHVGSLVAVVWVYRERVGKVLAGGWRGVAKREGRTLSEFWAADADFRLFIFVGLATLPTGIIAILVGPLLEGWAGSLAFVGAALLVNACILLVLGHLLQKGTSQRGLDELTWKDALLIGIAQGLAVTRGISRSGSTITAGVALGIRQDAAAAFSFLLSIPAILGALVLTLKDFDGELDALLPGIFGAVIAAIVGIVALKLLLRLLDKGRLGLFAGYCAAVGTFALVWHFAS